MLGNWTPATEVPSGAPICVAVQTGPVLATAARRLLSRCDRAQRGTSPLETVRFITLVSRSGALATAFVPAAVTAAVPGDGGSLWPALLAIAAVLLFLGIPLVLLMRNHRRLEQRLADCQQANERALAASQASHEVTRSQVEMVERNFGELRKALHALPVPLSAALSNAERLSMLAGDHATLRHEASALAEQLQGLLGDVGALLETAELEQHDVRLSLQELDLAALLRGVCAHYALRAGEKRQRLDCQADLPAMVNADLSRLREALEQMVAFALRATPPGEQIGVRLRQQGRMAVLEVHDRAPVFKPTQVAQLFERGNRGPGVSTTQESGLWVVQRVAELHGGDVQLVPWPHVGNDQEGNALLLRIPLAETSVRPPGGAATAAT